MAEWDYTERTLPNGELHRDARKTFGDCKIHLSYAPSSKDDPWEGIERRMDVIDKARG